MSDNTQPDALRLAGLLELAPENGVEPQTTEDAAAELRRLHTENTALQQGYAAARLEIESLRGRSVPVSEADMVLAAMETGEWELQRLLPQTCFTSEANIRNAWSVKRSAAPYCTKDGLRIWTGATPLEALCNGAAALGVELPGCSETAALPKTVVAILGEQAELRRLSDCCPELNLSNYGPDDVDELNGWAIEVSQCIDRAMRAAQPAGAQAAPELTETAVTAKNPAAPVSSFEDSRTQAVYEVLVNDNYPPAGSNEHWEGWKARLIVDALFPIEAPAAVAGPVAFTAEHVTYIRRYGGSCRDCADENGVCPNRGLPCADSEKAIRFVLEALAYGINHGYIAAPTTQPAPQQEAQEPVAWYVTGCGRLLDEYEAEAEARRIGGTAKAMPLYTVPQPSPASQGDALDAERYRWLRERMLGIDFDWNESGITALSFEMPEGCAYGGCCNQNIDAARATADSVTAPAATCHTCEAPCTTTVNMRGGEHGWGTTDLERTVYHYAPAQAADSVLEDAARLDWLLLHISGAEFRRIGVHYSGNASRADVDAARKQGANHD